ncbi:MAG: DinB family protein [Candidatus Dormibacteraeota bacterium]|nr:DinB family protein [Candidatus Dormibacteraeota bacterium]
MVGSGFLGDTIALLERTPRALRELLSAMPDGWLDEPDIPNGWKPRDVVGHLISAEIANWIPRVTMVVEKGTREEFDGFDRFAHVERDARMSLDDLVQRFSELREASLNRLRELVSGEADLDRRGRHPEFGEVTLRQLLSAWAVHDLDHLQQILPSLAASRDQAVGPWKGYLGILLRRDTGRGMNPASADRRVIDQPGN